MEKIVFDDNSQLISKEYTDLFYSNLGLRPSCGTCKYSTYRRISDFTVADYWGIENYNQEFYDNKGISLIMLNSSRAKDLFEYIREECDVIESDVQKCQQPNIIAPSPIPNYRSLYWKELKKYGFKQSLKKFTPFGGVLTKIRKRVFKYTGRWL